MISVLGWNGSAGRFQLEHADDCFEPMGLGAQRVGRGGGLLHERGVLLGAPVHVVDGMRDALDAAALLGAGMGDLAHDVGHPLHARHHALHGAAGLVDELAAQRDLFNRVGDQALDLLGSFGAAAGQAAHLTGHHSEAAALLARARCFDSGVQRQDVGLEGDAVDGADDVGDLLRTLADVAHGRDDALHHLAAPRCHAAGGRCELGGRLGGVGVLAHRGVHLLHRRRRLLKVGGLLLGALRQVGIAAGDLAGTGQDGVGTAAHLGDDLHQAIAHASQCGQQLGDLVAALGADVGAQVAAGDGLGEADRLTHRRRDRAGDQPGHAQPQQQRERGQRDAQADGRRSRGLALLVLRGRDIHLQLDELVREFARLGGQRQGLLFVDLHRSAHAAGRQGGTHRQQALGDVGLARRDIALGQCPFIGRELGGQVELDQFIAALEVGVELVAAPLDLVEARCPQHLDDQEPVAAGEVVQLAQLRQRHGAVFVDRLQPGGDAVDAMHADREHNQHQGQHDRKGQRQSVADAQLLQGIHGAS
mmetsp:Transcript_5840/g.22859  ORF Transcript_5840/g.22859 Transcript_5840/m.22859 type:complete len:533 (+) Transcript_5840:963-2561(+)